MRLSHVKQADQLMFRHRTFHLACASGSSGLDMTLRVAIISERVKVCRAVIADQEADEVKTVGAAKALKTIIESVESRLKDGIKVHTDELCTCVCISMPHSKRSDSALPSSQCVCVCALCAVQCPLGICIGDAQPLQGNTNLQAKH